MMSITDHEPKMNQLIRVLLWIGLRMDTLVRYAAFFLVLVRMRIPMIIPSMKLLLELDLRG